MIMNHKKKSFEQGSSEEFGFRFKISIFNIMHQMIQNNVVNPPIYALLLTIELVQLLYYPIHPIIDFLWDNSALSYMQLAIRYFQFNYLIEQGPPMFQFLLYGSLGVLGIYAAIFFGLQYQLSQSNHSEALTMVHSVLLKFMSFFSIMLNTILSLPFYNIFLASVYCRAETNAGKDLNCYEGIHVLHLITASLGLITLLFFNIVITLLYFDFNPKSKFPMNGFQSSAEYAKVFYKLVLPFLIIFNAPGNFNSEMSVLYGVGFLGILYFRYSSPSGYNLQVHYYKVSLEIILVWESVCVNITDFLDQGSPDDMGLLYFFIMIPPIVIGGIYLFKQKQKEFLTIDIRNLRNDSEADNYILQLLIAIQHRNDPAVKLRLYGMLKIHFNNCATKQLGPNGEKLDQCVCQKLIQVDQTKEESQETSRLWTRLYSQVVNDIVNKYQDCPRFRIFYAYVANDELKNKYNALHYMMKAEDKKAALREEFCLYRFKQHIEYQLQEEAELSQEIDVNKIVRFENEYVILTQEIMKCVEIHLEFWRELQEDNPNIIKLQNIGIKVLQQIDYCNELFEILIELNPNNLSLLEIYSNFLIMIVHDNNQAQEYSQQATLIKKSIFQRKSGAQESKITDSQDTIIVTMSGNYEDLGVVFSCNNQIYKGLGFYASEVVGQNVKTLMPKSIGEYHDKLVTKFLENSQSQVMGKERYVYASNKGQFIQPCKLMIKVLPSLDRGIIIVGFLSPQQIQENEYFMIYEAQSQTIHNFSQGMMDDFGLSFEQVQQDGSLSVLFKDLCDALEQVPQHQATLADVQQQDQTQHKIDWSIIYTKSDDGYFPCSVDGAQVKQLKTENMRESMKKRDIMVESAVNPLASKIYLAKFKIRIYLVEQRIFEDSQIGLVLHLVKIVMDGENEEFSRELSMMKSRAQKNQEQQLRVKSLEDEKQALQQEQELIENQKEAEEEKQVRDLRDALEDQKIPRQIIYLKYLSLVLFLSIMGLSIAKLVLSLQTSVLIEECVTAIRQAHARHSIMADVNLYSRYLSFVAQNIYPPQLEEPYKANISVLVDRLQSIQFDLIELRIKIESRVGYALDNERYDIKFLLTTNETRIFPQIFNDAVFAYITSASSFKKAPLKQLQDSSSSIGKNFYYVIENGLYVLRNGSEKIAGQLSQFYKEQAEESTVNSIAILVCALLLIVICNLLYIPILVTIHHEKKLLISFFGMIYPDDIRMLVEAGDHYMLDYIKKDTEQVEELGNQNHESQNRIESKSASSVIHNEGSIQEMNLDHPSPKADIKDASQRKSLFDIQREKHQRMYESKGGNHYGLVFAFVILGSLLMVEYIVMYVIEDYSLEYTLALLNHYTFICRRASIVKYNILFTLEFLINNGTSLTYKGVDLSQEYNDRVYTNEQELFKTLTQSYPSAFDSYFDYFNKVNYFNICDHIRWTDQLEQITQSFIFYDSATNQTAFSSSGLKTECSEVKGGLLQKGLRDAIFLISLGNYEILASFESLEETMRSGAIEVQEKLRKFILPTFWENNNLFQSCFQSYVDERNGVQIYNFIGFIIFLILMFLFLWFSYIQRVQHSIFQSQRMLTMLPKDLIEKYPDLKQKIEQHVLGQKHQDQQQ